MQMYSRSGSSGFIEMSAPNPLNPGVVPKGHFRLGFKAMGTQCEILYRADSEKQAVGYREEALAWVKWFEQRYTRFKEDSLVGRINAAAGKEWVELEDRDAQLFDLCGQLHFLTEGLFDPTTLPLSLIWDFRVPDPVPPPESEIRAALGKVGWARVERKSNAVRLPEAGMGMDFGGFGKEYAVDQVFEMASGHGIQDILVNFGGDVRAQGSPPNAPVWHVGVEDPLEPGKAGFVLTVSGLGVATSGTYLRHFDYGGQRYSHILDHRTGYPAGYTCHSVTVVARNCLEAGVWATCCLIEGGREGIGRIDRTFGAEGCAVFESGLRWTNGFHQYLKNNETGQ